jgi:Fic family protein
MTTTVAGVMVQDEAAGDAAAVDAGVTLGLLLRIRGEFLEMPGMRLTLRQAMRLWNLDAATCEAALRHLVEHRFLSYTAQGAFRRWEA